MSRRKLAWKWLKRVVLTLLTLVVVIVVFTLVALQTDWGQRQVKKQVVSALSESFAGHVEIERVEVGLSGSVVVEGVRIDYPDGSPAIRVERLSITCDIWPLLGGRVRCGELRAVAPQFWQRLDSGPLLRPNEEKTRVDLEFAAVAVERGRIELAAGEVISEIKVRLETIDVLVGDPGSAVAMSLETFEALFENYDRRVSVTGKLELADNKAKLVGGVVKTGDSELSVELDHFELPTLAMKGHVSGTIAAADVPVDGWRTDITPNLTIAGVAGESVVVSGTIGAGGGSVAVEHLAIGDRLEARLALDAIDPAKIHRDAPSGSISSETITADLGLQFGLGRLAGTAKIPLSGTLEGEELGTITATVAADRGHFDVGVEAQSPRGSGTLEVHAAALLSPWGSAWFIKDARARGEVSPLARLVPGLRVRSAVVNAQARGPLSALVVSGSATVSKLSYNEMAAERAFASVDLKRLDALAAPRPSIGGSFRAEIEAPRFGETRAASVAARGTFSERTRRVDAQIDVKRLDRLETATVALDATLDDVITARIRSLDAVVDGMRWRGGGATIRKAGDRITTPRRLTLSSDAGSLTIGADVTPRRTAITAELDGLDVWKSRRLHGVDNVRAVIDGEAEVVMAGKQLTGQVSARSSKIAVDGVPALSGEIAARLGASDVELSVSGKPLEGGASASFAVVARRPADVTNPASWRALTTSAITKLEADIRGVDVATVERFTGNDIEAEGAVAVKLRLPYEGRKVLGVEIDADRGRYVGIGGLSSRVRATWGDRLDGTVSLQQAGDDVATVRVGLGAPLHALWQRPESLANRPLDASLSITNFSLRRLERLAIVKTSLGGFVTATATVKGTLAKPVFAIENGRAARVDVAGLIMPKLFFDAVYRGGDSISGRLAGTIRGGGRFEAKGNFDVPRLALQAEVNGRGIKLEALRPFAPEPDHPLADLGGLVDVTGVVVNVDPSSMRASGRIRLRKGQVLLEGGARPLTDIEASVVLRGDRIRLARFSARNGSGRISASGEARFEGYEPKSIEVDVSAVDLPYVAGSYLASIDLEGKLVGGFEDGVLAIRAPISRGRVDLVDTGQRLQNIGDLEDVVFVDAKAKARRAREGAPSKGLKTIIQVDLSRGVRVVMKEVDAVIVGALEAVFVGPEMTSLSGQLRARSGRVELFDRRYELVRAEATFDGPLPMNPDLDIEITRTFPEATVTARIAGRLSQVLSSSTQAKHIQLTSDASFSEEQILALMLGQNPDDVAQQDTGGSKVGGIGRAVLASEIRDILRSVGLKVDVVRFHEDGWEFGKWVNFSLGDLFSRRVLLGYRFRDSGDELENTNEGTLELPITRSINLEGRVGDRGIGNIDLLWIKRF